VTSSDETRGRSGRRFTYHPFEVALCGYSGAGKTTLACRLLARWAGRYRVGFVFDTSGSVSDEELGLYLKELRACLRSYSHMCDVMYFSADTRVHTQMQVHLGDLKPERLQIRGGGGTDLDKVIEEIAAMRRPPQVLFVLTDGETPWPAEKPRTIERVVIGLSAPPSPTFPPPRWADHIVALYEREAERSLG